jgi:ABC-type lipoprotein release transport system permease subunit
MLPKLKQKLKQGDAGNVQLILMAVVAAIVLAVSIIIVYAVIAGIDYSTIDKGMGWNGSALDKTRPALNASNSLQTNLATFYSVAPIYIVVLAAVGIISAIMMIVITKKK